MNSYNAKQIKKNYIITILSAVLLLMPLILEDAGSEYRNVADVCYGLGILIGFIAVYRAKKYYCLGA